jgi:hypothetical protein
MVCRHAPDFVQSNTLSHIQPIISDKFSTCTSSSKQLRLRCLEAIVVTLVNKCHQSGAAFSGQMAHSALRNLITQTVSEIILCTKEQSGKCRSAASDVLVSFCLCFPAPFGQKSEIHLIPNRKDYNLAKLNEKVSKYTQKKNDYRFTEISIFNFFSI